jgi:hypothetical protein
MVRRCAMVKPRSTKLTVRSHHTYRKSSLPIFILALPTFLLALGITAGIIIQYGPESFTFLYEKWVGFITAAFLMSTFQALYVQLMSYRGNKLLALAGNSGNHIYDVGESAQFPNQS